jgi:hydroxymethylpyrimidine pyrophosphatase-like HAD family hydrolase
MNYKIINMTNDMTSDIMRDMTNDTILVFDIDGTLVESSQSILPIHAEILNKLKNKYDIAVCCGGMLNKVKSQMNNLIQFDHYFTENGCVYYDKFNDKIPIYNNNIRNHRLYPLINELVKCALIFFGNVDYLLTGHLIDLRNGLIYISCVGMQATNEERNMFIELDKQQNIRNNLRNKYTNQKI